MVKDHQANLRVQFFQDFCQLQHINRLDEIVIKPGGLAHGPVARLAMTSLR